MIENVELTEKGFEWIHFIDYSGKPCSLQQSNLIYPRCIWLGVIGKRMHLDVPMVKALVEVLNNWIETESFQKIQEKG